MSAIKQYGFRADGVEIAVITSVGSENEYFSLTDIARHRNPETPNNAVRIWLNLRSTKEFLGFWEQKNNPNYNPVNFNQLGTEADSTSFVVNPKKWVNSTNAISLLIKSDIIFAHKDIAFEFASWISPKLKQHITKHYHCLKKNEILHHANDGSFEKKFPVTYYCTHAKVEHTFNFQCFFGIWK